ncbi:virion assembly protein [Pigeonpox virus]|uniref:DNA packaging protein OPG160 n=1 Tax=Pigeonpox virus TaxID=10264 RepID=A0A068EGG3_9POXV|nr:virion assembly protein [Pigeonpox virus]AID46705.1 virion assembly protein [Pigeonpox virus]WCL40146.1 virion assembly protein [Pigeonpox virus]
MDIVREVKFNRNSLLNDYFRMVILGGSGSGKTTFLLSLFKTFIAKYKHIFLFTPILNSSYNYYVWPDHIYKITTAEELEYSLSKMKQDLVNLGKKGSINHKFLVILDDLGDMQLKSKILSWLVNTGRHIKMSIVMLCQTYRHVPSNCRSSITHLCCCNVSDADIENITRSMSLVATKQIIKALSVMRAASRGKKVYIIENTVFANKDIRICYDTADKSVIEQKSDTTILLSQFSHMKDQLHTILNNDNKDTDYFKDFSKITSINDDCDKKDKKICISSSDDETSSNTKLLKSYNKQESFEELAC